MYIAIAGNIGSGKTYLTELLSARLGWEAQYEETENPYIGDFYDDMKRWAFNLQVYFLGKRQRQIDAIASREIECRTEGTGVQSVVVDRTIYEDAQVFATSLHRVGVLASRDYTTYMQLYRFTEANLLRPRLLVYLRASVPTLVSQIQRRGRVYEASIDAAYLEGLNRLYEEWIVTYDGPKLIVDVDREDFVTDPSAREAILERIAKQIDGSC